MASSKVRPLTSRDRVGIVVVAAVTVVFVTVVLVGCGSSTSPSSSISTGGNQSTRTSVARCGPSPLRLRPRVVKAGGTLTVESAPFTCHAHYLADKTYTVTLGQVGRADPVRLKSVPVRRDGAFRTSVRIPRTASPGQSFIVVKGSLFDRCRDTASCAGYTAPVRVLAPS
jgi:hypothetical protein